MSDIPGHFRFPLSKDIAPILSSVSPSFSEMLANASISINKIVSFMGIVVHRFPSHSPHRFLLFFVSMVNPGTPLKYACMLNDGTFFR